MTNFKQVVKFHIVDDSQEPITSALDRWLKQNPCEIINIAYTYMPSCSGKIIRREALITFRKYEPYESS